MCIVCTFLLFFVLFMMIDLFNVFSPFYLCIYFYYYNIQLWSLNPVLVLDEEQEEGFFLISLTRYVHTVLFVTAV